MNKTKIAIGVIVALGIIWTGAAWLTGKQIENHKEEVLQNINAHLGKIPGAPLQARWQHYHRGIFGSRTQLVLQPDAHTTDNAILSPGQQIVLNTRIDHGPLPLGQLKTFNLLPALASVHAALENTPAVAALFEHSKGVSFFQSETRIGYGGATKTAVSLFPIDYLNAQTGDRYASNGGEIKVNSDREGNRLDFRTHFPSVIVTGRNAVSEPVLFTFGNVKLSGKTHLSPEGIRIGEQHIGLQKMTASVNGNTTLELDDMQGQTQINSSNGKLNGQIAYQLGDLLLQNQSFGQGSLKLNVSQLDAQALKTFQQRYYAGKQALLQQPNIASNSERYQQQLQRLLADNLPLLLKGGPGISLAPLNWKNAKGESHLSLTLHFHDPATVKGEAQTPAQRLQKTLQTFDGKLTIAIPMATEIMKQVARLEGYNEKDAQKLADRQINGFTALGQMFRLTTQQDNNIVTSLHYDNNEVVINGKKMSPDDFLAGWLPGITPMPVPNPTAE